MDIREFGKIMEAEIRDELGRDYIVEYREIPKNNKVVRHAVGIRNRYERVEPTIYIDDMYRKYLNGTVMMNLVRSVISIYREYVPKSPVDVDFYNDFATVADRLTFKLINAEGNESQLKDVPYKKFEDLAMIPMCIVENNYIGSGSIIVRNSHLELWEISKDELWENVMDNAPKITPVKIEDICETLGYNEDDPRVTPKLKDMFVVSNKDRSNGAGVVLYPGVLKELAKRLKSDLYIIPSSVHETVVVKATGGDVGLSTLYWMVRDINATYVRKEEFLSNNVYFYKKSTDRLKLTKDPSIA